MEEKKRKVNPRNGIWCVIQGMSERLDDFRGKLWILTRKETGL